MTETTFAVDEIKIDTTEFFQKLAELQEEFEVNDLAFVCLLSSALGDIVGTHVKHGCCSKELFVLNIQANFERQFAFYCNEQVKGTAH